MIIKNISISPHQYEILHYLETSSISHQKRDSWIIKITDYNGLVGVGEASPLPNINHETFNESGYALEGFRLAINGITDNIDDNEMMILVKAHTMHTPSAAFAIHTAIYDILSKQNKISLSKYLNAKSFSKLKINGIEGLTQSTNYTTIKVKCGFRNLYDEIEFLDTLSNKYNSKVKFIIDLNQAYDLSKAIRFLKEIEQFNIEYVEQPLHKDNIEDAAELRFHSDIPLALDESIHNIDTINYALDHNAADVFIIKPQVIGSFSVIEKAINIVRNAGKKVTLTSSLEGSIGRYSTMHLASLNKIDMCCGVAIEKIYIHEKHTFPNINSGVIEIPKTAGLGIE